MLSATVELRNVEGTEAAVGWAGAHTVVVDRPDGKAGGRGLGFNGAEILALTIGGCFCNDLRYVSHAKGVTLGKIAVSVTVELDGNSPPWRQGRRRAATLPKNSSSSNSCGSGVQDVAVAWGAYQVARNSRMGGRFNLLGSPQV